MNSLITSTLLVFCSIAVVRGWSQNAYLIRNVSVISMTDESVAPDQDVLVQDAKIITVTPSGTIPTTTATVIDGEGQYVMPGISEMHAHIPVPAEGDNSYVREVLFLYLSNGITTIRGMLGNPYHLELRRSVANGEIQGPRIYTSSPSLNGNSVPTAEEAIAKVKQYAADGYDFLKIHPGIPGDVMEALVSTAKKSGIRFAGHVPADVGIRKALQYGYWSVDHVDGFMEGLAPENYNREAAGSFGSGLLDEIDMSELPHLCKMMRQKKVWLVPTQSLFTRWISPKPPEEMIQTTEMAYMPAAVRYQWVSSKTAMLNAESYSAKNYYEFLAVRQDIIRCLHENNVGFLLGSDAPQVFNVPGFSIQHEMQSLSDAGLSNFAILQSGTINPAVFLDREGDFGQIVEGAEADLILLGGNPILDLKEMKNIVGVMFRGTWLSRAEIDRRVDEIEQRHASD